MPVAAAQLPRNGQPKNRGFLQSWAPVILATSPTGLRERADIPIAQYADRVHVRWDAGQ